MISAPLPVNESERLSTLYDYDLLDTMAEKDYDDITQIAADICKMPISLISLIDKNRQWFKSRLGLDATETPRDVAFCAHAILTPDEMLVVPDSSKDERFADNPLAAGAPHVCFYAGVPLVTNNGSALGTLCVIDNKPNSLTDDQKETLKALARQIVAYFEIRQKNKKLDEQKIALEQINKDLSSFAYAVAHDIKSPLSSLAMSTGYLKEVYANVIDEDGAMMLDMMDNTSRTAIRMVDGILRYTDMVNNVNTAKESFTFFSLANEVKSLLLIPEGFAFRVKNAEQKIFAPRYMLMQIILNLCTNGIKYNNKPNGTITVSATENEKHYTFSVADNGNGIKPGDQKKIFELFSTLGLPDRDNNVGTGIGLSTVKRLVEKLGGTISVTSTPGEGSTFEFTIIK